MTPEMIDLAKRAVACRGWRWMPGMLHGTQGEGGLKWTSRFSDLGLHVDADRLPDLTDPATLGCLLALVREAWGDSGMFVRPRGSKMRPDWAVFTGQNSDLVCAASTEAEALIIALAHAP